MTGSFRRSIVNSLITLFVLCTLGQAQKKTPDVIYVPTDQVVVDEMLRTADVSKDDNVYDLGCGDGRLVITAAKQYGARGVGIDIDPERIKESNANAVKAGVTDRVKFLEQDLFQSDFRPATAVTLYLLTTLNEKLRPILFQQLKPGTPVVSHDFGMGDWKPDQQKTVKGQTRDHGVYLWYIPANAAGVWQFQDSDGKPQQLTVQQTFQQLDGNLTVNGQEIAKPEMKIQGDELTMVIPGTQKQFTGRVKGDVIDGTMAGQKVQMRRSQPATAAIFK
jgi:SAM-dependent methyltransferase